MKRKFTLYNPDSEAIAPSGKRKTSRIDVDLIVSIAHTELGTNDGLLLDYSASGGRIRTKLNLKVNDLIEISLSKSAAYFARAIVMRKSEQNAQEYGVRWLEWFEKRFVKGTLFKGRI